MPTATFSAHKRNRPLTTKAQYPPDEPVSKLSRLKSGLARFSKFTLSFSSRPEAASQSHFRNHDSRSRPHHGHLYFSSGFFSNEKHNESARRNLFTLDSSYEHERHRRASLNHKQAEAKGNIPHPSTSQDNVVAPSVPQSILIKRESFVNEHRVSLQSSGILTGSNLSVPTQRHKSSTQHLRDSSHVSSSMTVNSEDLTAKEFADIAGIRILSDSDNSEEGLDGDTTSMRSRHLHSSVYSNASLRSHDAKSFTSARHRKPQIWDSEFWKCPDNRAADKTSRSQPKRVEYITNELRRINTRSSDRLSSLDSQANRSCIIKKGRFEIHLETADASTDQIVPSLLNPTNNAKDSLIRFDNKKKKPCE